MENRRFGSVEIFGMSRDIFGQNLLEDPTGKPNHLVKNRKDRKQQEYLGDRDEMGAFAFNIACEMIDRFGYEPRVISQYMDTNEATRHKNSWWYSYLKGFEFNHNHKIIQRMKHKILRQLENAYIGKPFKTTDWLTH